MRIYSDGTRVIGIDSIVGYDLENPMMFFFEGLGFEKEIYILTELSEFRECPTTGVYTYDDAAALIDDQADFTGDTDYMTPDNLRAYVEKHFHVAPFSKSEHGLSSYWMGAARGWDCGTAGYFLLPKKEWSAAEANAFSVDCNYLMECMTAWVNGDEWTVTDYYLDHGALDYDTCGGYYGENDALSEACIGGYTYIGEYDADDTDDIMAALAIKLPSFFTFVEHVEHVPEKVITIPAHDETRTEFVRLS